MTSASHVGTILFCIAGLACSESNEGTASASGPGSGGAGGGSTSNGASGSGANGGASNGGSGPGGGSAVDVVVNEIAAEGDDWVELFNPGDAPFDLGGYGLCDSDAGAPKLAEAVRFDDGETLAPGAFLVVVADLMMPGVGKQTDCTPLTIGSCYHGGWGISSPNGDIVFLVDADDMVVAQTEYPANATAAGETYGRLPDGTGAFEVTSPTPAAANAAP